MRERGLERGGVEQAGGNFAATTITTSSSSSSSTVRQGKDNLLTFRKRLRLISLVGLLIILALAFYYM